MIGTNSSKSSVNTSLPDRVVERLHYEAKFHDAKARFQDGVEVDVSINYNGGELREDQVELVEHLVGYLIWNEVPSNFFH